MVNTLLKPSPLPYQLPDFASVTLDDIREAIDQGLAQARAEVDKIATNPEPATFANTTLALELSGDLLTRALHTFFTVVAADSTPEMRDYEEELSPRLADFHSEITLDPRLWSRIDAVHATVDSLDLDEESKTLVQRQWLVRKLAGADLDETTRARVTELNSQIATLQANFEKNLLEDTNDAAVVFDDAAALDGLADGDLSACADRAKARGLEGKYVVKLLNFTNHPYLASLTNRESRRTILEAQFARGGRGNQWDTSAIVLELASLRAELADLLGFGNHVARKVADQAAGTPQAIEELVYPMAAPARRNAEREAAALQAEADRDADERGVERFQIEAWDWQYYTAKLRAREFAVDEAALAPYFEYNRVLVDGVFWAANQLYGITFTERDDLKGWNDDVRVFEVADSDGSPVGLFLHDVYTREGKRGGAWMNNVVDQSTELGTRPVICNNLNVPKPAAGQPTLLTLDQVETMFHEFGHALHGLFANTRFASLSGTSVPRDFVEFPSQVNEMWAMWPEVLAHYARHYATGEALDEATRAKLSASDTFNQGFATSEYLAAALLDQEWHKIPAGTTINDVDEFEAAALARVGLDNPLVPPRYKSRYFAHTFGGGYDGAYYAYIWSEVLDADTVEWFTENGGLTRANGDQFRRELLSRGRTRDLAASYRAFRGRDPEVGPLLRRRGLTAD